jgi:hypothetical protein
MRSIDTMRSVRILSWRGPAVGRIERGNAVARVNVYLSDDLAAKVKAANIEVSPVCQTALAEAVELRSRNVSDRLDLVAAARRLRATTPKFQYEEGKASGREWVTQVATFEELEFLDCINGVSQDDEGDWNFSFTHTREVEPPEGTAPEGYVTVMRNGEQKQYPKWITETVDAEWDDSIDLGALFEADEPDTLTIANFLHARKRIGDNNYLVVLDEWFRGFVDGAKEAWAELRELLTLDDSTLQRRQSLLADYEKETVTQAATTDAPPSAENPQD